MLVTAAELMKQLKYIENEIEDVYNDDQSKSVILVEKNIDNRGKTILKPVYEEAYDFNNNRKRIKELFAEERKIRNALNSFNNQTLVSGYDFNISEGLVRISELKKEIHILSILAKKNSFWSSSNYRNDEIAIYKASYSIEDAKNALREAQRELSALQVGIDKTNLNSKIEIE